MVIKWIAPNILLIPDKWKVNIVKCTAPPEWLAMLLKGGWTAQPVPAPTSTSADLGRKSNQGGKSQKLMLFLPYLVLPLRLVQTSCQIYQS